MGVLVAAQQRVFRAAVFFGWVQFVAVIGFLSSATGANMAAAVNLAFDQIASQSNESDELWSTRELWANSLRTIGRASHELGLALSLRDDNTEEYHDESNYSAIIVGEERWEDTDEVVRFLRIDKLIHAYYNPDRPEKLYYDYERIYAEALDRIVDVWRKTGLIEQQGDKSVVDSFFVGGGGYVFPRWMERRFAPASVIEVAEIDPAVTQAVRREMGLPASDKTRIVNIVGDARNVLDDRLRRNAAIKTSGAVPVLYDFAFGDAFNDFSVPWHLVTVEFTRKIQRALKPHGIYMVNIIDRYPRTELKRNRIPLPVQLTPQEISEDWRAAPAPYEALEVKADKDQLWLGIRGAMPASMRDQLLGLAPEQQVYAAAIKELYMRSAERRSGRFLARFVNTLREVFGNIYVYSTDFELPHADRDTMVIVASPTPLPVLKEAHPRSIWPGKPFAMLETVAGKTHIDSRMATLLTQAEDLILSDDFAPVDNLLLPVVATQE